MSDDVLLAHLEFVTDVAWTPDGTGYVTTFGSCNSTEMLEPAQLLRRVEDDGREAARHLRIETDLDPSLNLVLALDLR